MKVLLIFLILLGSVNVAVAANIDLDSLLREVKRSQSEEAKINREREARFLASKNQQQRLLTDSRTSLANQKNQSLRRWNGQDQ